jgi:hypothetical protein
MVGENNAQRKAKKLTSGLDRPRIEDQDGESGSDDVAERAEGEEQIRRKRLLKMGWEGVASQRW